VRALNLRACVTARARELGAADSRGKAEVVLDPARRPGLAAERGALDDQGVEPFGGAVDRGREACRTGSDDQQVDLLAWRELEPDPESAQHLAGCRAVQLTSPRQPHERQRDAAGRGGILPGVGEPVRARELEHSHRLFRIVRADDLEIPCTVCSASRREMNVESRRSLSGPSSVRSDRSALRATAM
jgi:hypothetical protein